MCLPRVERCLGCLTTTTRSFEMRCRSRRPTSEKPPGRVKRDQKKERHLKPSFKSRQSLVSRTSKHKPWHGRRRRDVCTAAASQTLPRANKMDEPKLCPICSKPFASEAALGAHLTRCLERVGPQRKPQKTPKQDDDARGRVMCYVCGQRVLTPQSLALHLKKCEKAAAVTVRLTAECGAPAQPLPKRPAVALPRDATDVAGVKAWNAAAKAAFEASLPTCPKCDRRFAAAPARDAHAKRCAGTERPGGRLVSWVFPEDERPTLQKIGLFLVFVAGTLDRDLAPFAPQDAAREAPSVAGARGWAVSERTDHPRRRSPGRRPAPEMNRTRRRGDAAAVDSPRRRVAATPRPSTWIVQRRRVAATPRPSTLIFGDGFKRRGVRGRHYAGDDDPGVAKVLAAVGRRAAVCVYCGTATLAPGLAAHGDACEVRWRRNELALPENERREPPTPPFIWEPTDEDALEKDGKAAHRAALQAYNRFAATVYVESVRRGASIKCSVTGRTFKDPETRRRYERRALGLSDQVEDAPRAPPAPVWRASAAGAALAPPQGDIEPYGANCYLCGLPCLVNSLRRHVRRCRSRWELAEMAREIDQPMRPLPTPPAVPEPPADHDYYGRKGKAPRQKPPDSEAAHAADAAARQLLDDWNAAARRIYDGEGVVACETCGRTFGDRARRDAHAKRCGKGDLLKKSAERFEEDERKPDAAALCPICGKRALLGSLLRHVDTCKQKWEATEAIKPVDRRRPAPAWPDVPLPRKPGANLDAWNAAIANDRRTHACPGCDRRFERPEAREAHVKRCCPAVLGELSDGEENQFSPRFEREPQQLADPTHPRPRRNLPSRPSPPPRTIRAAAAAPPRPAPAEERLAGVRALSAGGALAPRA